MTPALTKHQKKMIEFGQRHPYCGVWRVVPGTNNRYFISNQGEVLRVTREGLLVFSSPAITKEGYNIVSIRGKSRRLCRLVADLFCEKRPWKTVVNHRNSVRNDDRASNLEWVTPKENTDHGFTHGNCKYGVEHHWTKLSVADIRSIRSSKTSTKELAAKYQVNRTTIQKIRSWKGRRRESSRTN